jgi:hypothetical protein
MGGERRMTANRASDRAIFYRASLLQQRGMTFWGLLFVFGTLAFFAIVTMKVLPIYLNQMKIDNAVKSVVKEAKSDGGGQLNIADIQRSLEKRWDIEDVNYLDWHDVRAVNTNRGRVLAYDYEAREHLFYNIFIVVHFEDQIPLPGGSSGGDG